MDRQQRPVLESDLPLRYSSGMKSQGQRRRNVTAALVALLFMGVVITAIAWNYDRELGKTAIFVVVSGVLIVGLALLFTRLGRR